MSRSRDKTNDDYSAAPQTNSIEMHSWTFQCNFHP